MKRRERSPDKTVERKGRFTVITEEIPGNEQKRTRPDSRQHQAGPSGPRQPAPPPLQQQQPASQGGEQPQQPGGVEQQGESGQDRPPPEPPPPRGPPEPAPKWEASPRRCSGEVLPRTVGVLGGSRQERGTRGAYGNQMRDQYGRLEGFTPDTILAIQEFKGIITTMERILRQELLTAAEDMKINPSFTFLPFVEAFAEFLLPNTIVRWNGIVITTKTADFGLNKVMAIFAADTESLQRACCSHVVGLKHLLQGLAVYRGGRIIASHGHWLRFFHVRKFTAVSATSYS